MRTSLNPVSASSRLMSAGYRYVSVSRLSVDRTSVPPGSHSSYRCCACSSRLGVSYETAYDSVMHPPVSSDRVDPSRQTFDSGPAGFAIDSREGGEMLY